MLGDPEPKFLGGLYKSDVLVFRILLKSLPVLKQELAQKIHRSQAEKGLFR